MRVVSAEEIDRTLDMPGLVEALSRAFRAGASVPLRHHHTLPRGDKGTATLLLMPAWSAPDSPSPVIGTKIVTVFPDNAARALPSVMGSYLLMDGASGLPLAVMDGARLTLWRTAAASALAARHLARPDAARLLVMGAGALCPFLVKAHSAERRLSDIAIWNHRPERAAEAAAALAGQGFPARAVTDAALAAREADIISCATLSQEPILMGEWLRPGVHVDLVGAYNLSMREADDRALTRARRFVDTSAALTEGGDIAIAIRDGLLTQDMVEADLFALCRGEKPGRSSDDDITLFKSVGTALEDLAAAQLVLSRLR